ncbi:substrate-binding domain-containing protein [Protofrankia symbiont of Coriaria ruscifolia]|uniref:substrate-binding domain-containing protein n=1 Tax=Protofrankia symbiont of Coriaria ruscifolia TaxID=1306542 RepID=UPI0013EFB1CD|nr:substrate-binding domain-containing protein [Protofrankia symbiont of Coriaria ruscifolia]
MVASGDIAEAVSTLASRYAAGPGRGCTAIRVQAREPATVAVALAAGWDSVRYGLRPDVWIPDSSLWSRLLDAAPPDATRPDSGLGDVAARTGPPLAYSPLVLALPARMVDALHWSQHPLSWADVLHVLGDDRGWAAFGHPEWGPIRLAVADPARSTPALEALIAWTGATRGLGQEDYLPAAVVNQPSVVSALRKLRSRVSRTGSDTVSLLQSLPRAGEADQSSAAVGHPSMFVMSEQEVWRYNQGKPAIPLTAVYPADGTPVSDHPYLLLHPGDAPAGSRAAAAGFLRFLREPDSQTWLVSQAFRSGLGTEGAPFVPANGLRPDGVTDLLPATDGATLSRLTQVWNSMPLPAR